MFLGSHQINLSKVHHTHRQYYNAISATLYNKCLSLNIRYLSKSIIEQQESTGIRDLTN